jgi:hypothetical protein
MPNDFEGPFVNIACVCQVALQEGNNVLSIIRITDRVQVVGVNPHMQPQPLQNLALVVILRSGTLRGHHKLRIAPFAPNASPLQETEFSVLFEGDDRGPAVITPVGIVATEEGLYWFDLYLEQVLLARIPLRVLYQRIAALPGFQQPPS